VLPSMMETHELVVPKSIPIIFPILNFSILPIKFFRCVEWLLLLQSPFTTPCSIDSDRKMDFKGIYDGKVKFFID